MQLLEFVPFFSVFLIATLGLGSIALSLMVWRRRHHAMQGQGAWIRAVNRVVLPLGFVGSLAIILSLSLRTFFPRRGEIFVRDAIVVRADPTRGLPTLTAAETIDPGEILVAFAQPGQAAEVERLRLLEQRLAAERERLGDALPDIDPVLVRERQELTAERHQLIQRLAMFEIEQQRLEQQARNEIITKRIQLNEARVQIGDYDGQIAKTAAEASFETRLLEAARELHETSNLSEINFAERLRNVRVLEVDSARLTMERRTKLGLIEELERGIVRLEEMLAQQGSFVSEATAEVRSSLAAVACRAARLEPRITRDRERLARQQSTELREIDLRLADCAQQLRKLEDLAQVVCPTSARVLFRHPSPGSAQLGEPLLMYGPADAVRARFKLADGEAASLGQAGAVELLATSSELLAAGLSGRVVASEPLEHEHGMSIVELACVPTSSQLGYLARGLSLDSRLLWSPPPFADPLLLLGALLLGAAALPTLVGLLLRRHPRALPSTVQVAATSHANSA